MSLFVQLTELQALIDAENTKQHSIKKIMEPIIKQLEPYQNQLDMSHNYQCQLASQMEQIRLELIKQKYYEPNNIKDVKKDDLDKISNDTLEKLYEMNCGCKYELSTMESEWYWAECCDDARYFPIVYRNRLIKKFN